MRLSPQARCTLPMGSCEAGTDGSWTLRWREPDSNHRSRSCEKSLAVADERCRIDKLDGVIKHRSSRETTMVGRGAVSFSAGPMVRIRFPPAERQANSEIGRER